MRFEDLASHPVAYTGAAFLFLGWGDPPAEVPRPSPPHLSFSLLPRGAHVQPGETALTTPPSFTSLTTPRL